MKDPDVEITDFQLIEDVRLKLARLNIPYKQDAFFECVKEGDVVAVSLFLAIGMDPNSKGSSKWTPLMWAASAGHLSIIKELLSAEADVNATAKGATALTLAQKAGHERVVELLESSQNGK